MLNVQNSYPAPFLNQKPAQTKQEWESGGNEGGIPSGARNDGILLFSKLALCPSVR
jgi:hypothetical protein